MEPLDPDPKQTPAPLAPPAGTVDEAGPARSASQALQDAATASSPRHGFTSLAELLDMIKFEHTVFALPFALLGAMGAAPAPDRWPPG